MIYIDINEFNIYNKIEKLYTDSTIDTSYNSLYLDQEGVNFYTSFDNKDAGIFYSSIKNYYDILKSYKYMKILLQII